MLRYPADPAQCFYFNHFDRPVTRLHLHSHHIQTSRIEVFERFDQSGFENVFCDTITLPSHKTVACNIHVYIFLHVSVYTFVNFDSLLCIAFFFEYLVHCSSRIGSSSSSSIRGAWCFLSYNFARAHSDNFGNAMHCKGRQDYYKDNNQARKSVGFNSFKGSYHYWRQQLVRQLPPQAALQADIDKDHCIHSGLDAGCIGHDDVLSVVIRVRSIHNLKQTSRRADVVWRNRSSDSDVAIINSLCDIRLPDAGYHGAGLRHTGLRHTGLRHTGLRHTGLRPNDIPIWVRFELSDAVWPEKP